MTENEKNAMETAWAKFYPVKNPDTACTRRYALAREKFIRGFIEGLQSAALSDDGWTYCDDRLPEDDEDGIEYAITYLDFRDKVTPCFGVGIWADGEWAYDNGAEMLVKVIAWRRKPEPAKGRDV